jgi:hypothetical protein
MIVPPWFGFQNSSFYAAVSTLAELKRNIARGKACQSAGTGSIKSKPGKFPNGKQAPTLKNGR